MRVSWYWVDGDEGDEGDEGQEVCNAWISVCIALLEV
jgi:hypothetical protein